MDVSDAIRLRIIKLANKNNMTISKLCLLAGISRSTLSKFLSGQRKMIRVEIIELICEALNITLKDFFDDALFNQILDVDLFEDKCNIDNKNGKIK